MSVEFWGGVVTGVIGTVASLVAIGLLAVSILDKDE